MPDPRRAPWAYREEHDIFYKRPTEKHFGLDRVEHFGWGIKSPPSSPKREYKIPPDANHTGSISNPIVARGLLAPIGKRSSSTPPQQMPPAPLLRTVPPPARTCIRSFAPPGGQPRGEWDPVEFESMIVEKIRGKTKGANGQALRGIRLFTDVTEGVRTAPMVRTHPNGEPMRKPLASTRMSLANTPILTLPPANRAVSITPRGFRRSLEKLTCCPVSEHEAEQLFQRWDSDGGGELEPGELVSECLLPMPYSLMKIPPVGFVPGATFVNELETPPYKRRFGVVGRRPSVTLEKPPLVLKKSPRMI